MVNAPFAAVLRSDNLHLVAMANHCLQTTVVEYFEPVAVAFLYLASRLHYCSSSVEIVGSFVALPYSAAAKNSTEAVDFVPDVVENFPAIRSTTCLPFDLSLAAKKKTQ